MKALSFLFNLGGFLSDKKTIITGIVSIATYAMMQFPELAPFLQPAIAKAHTISDLLFTWGVVSWKLKDNLKS